MLKLSWMDPNVHSLDNAKLLRLHLFLTYMYPNHHKA